MSRFASIALLLAAAGLAAPGCGCGDNLHFQDDAGLPDAPEQRDAQADAPVPTAAACTIEFQRCEEEDPSFCLAEGLECVPVRVDTQAMVCLRRCADTSDCPFNSYCIPSDVQFGGLLLAAHHCFGSVCGHTYGNGDLFGACSVGGDNLVSLDAGQQRPGTCLPIDTDAGTGACVESADESTAAGRDETCTLDMAAAGCPGRADVVGCVTGTLCVGGPCEQFGSCRLLCDPRLDPEGECTLGAGSPKQYCQDISLLTLGASGVTHVGYVGVCQPNPRCRLFGEAVDGGVADGGAGAAGCQPDEGCYPTTMVTTNGVCATAGEVGAGEACQYLNDCVAGTTCVGTEVCGGGTCLPLCDLEGSDTPCEAGALCLGVALDPSQPGVVSRPWGVCLAAEEARRRAAAPLLLAPLVGPRR